MPGGDGTGPWGRGARTGRGMGYCPGARRYGYDHGWRRFSAPPMDAKELMEAERAALQNRLDYLTEQLDRSDEAK